jgi:hypothetical protein
MQSFVKICDFDENGLPIYSSIEDAAQHTADFIGDEGTDEKGLIVSIA